MKKKTVDIVFPGFINAPNGAARFVKTLKNNGATFKEKGIDLHVYTIDSYRCSNEKTFDNQNVIKRKSIIRSFLMRLAKYSRIATWLMIYFTSIRHSKKIINDYLKNTESSELIHFQDLFTCYYYLKHPNNQKAKVLLTLHSNGDLWSMLEEYYPLFRTKCFHSFKRKIERTVLSEVSLFNFVANKPRQFFLRKYKIDESLTSFIYNGIDNYPVIRESSSDKRIKLVCVGTLSNRKNQIGILESLSLLPPSICREFSLTFVGDGPERVKLEDFSRKIQAPIHFVGNSNNVDEYLKVADVFILYSKDEGLPISIVEAMRASLPIISTNIAGIPEMINNGVSGFLVNVDNIELKTVFEVLLSERTKLKVMGEESHKIFLTKFTIDAMINSYSNLWLEI